MGKTWTITYYDRTIEIFRRSVRRKTKWIKHASVQFLARRLTQEIEFLKELRFTFVLSTLILKLYIRLCLCEIIRIGKTSKHKYTNIKHKNNKEAKSEVFLSDNSLITRSLDSLPWTSDTDFVFSVISPECYNLFDISRFSRCIITTDSFDKWNVSTHSRFVETNYCWEKKHV